LRQHALRLRVIRMLLQKFEQNGPSFLRRAFDSIDSGQVQIRLVKGGRESDALFEARDCLVSSLGS
jgi:hypothetical protein